MSIHSHHHCSPSIKSTLLKNAMTLVHQDIVLKKGSRSGPRLRTMTSATLEQQQQHMLISQKERSRDRAAVAYSSKGTEEKGKDYRSWTSKKFVLEKRKYSFEHDTAKKGQDKELDQKSRSNETISQKGKIPEKHGEVHLKKKIVFHV